METGALGALNPSALERMWELHVAAAEHLADALAPRMQPGGRIVLIGSRTANGSAAAANMRQPRPRSLRWLAAGRWNLLEGVSR